MPSFSIASDGRLRDESAERVVDHALQEFPWLNGGGLSLYIALSKAYWDSSAQFADYCAAFDLSVPRFNLLWQLYQNHAQPLSMGEISARLSVSTAAVTKLVDGLERDGWASRIPHATDRRVVCAQLTEAGAQRFRGMFPTLLQRLGVLMGGLTDNERDLLTHLLTKLRVTALAHYAEPAAAALAADH